jgi:hypothetical protein
MADRLLEHLREETKLLESLDHALPSQDHRQAFSHN